MFYKYETHSHTAEGSKCGRIDGASLARLYKSLGYTGLVITDHFYKGNTAVPRELPWNEWVTEFVKGYENAKAEGDKIGLDVFFAWEYSAEYAADFLIYGLDANWLYENPDQIQLGTCAYLTKVREAGGIVIHAHPFRNPVKMLLPEWCDGVEIINANAAEPDNDRAKLYANSYNLRKIAGTDNHTGIREKMAGVYFTERIVDIHDFADRIKAGEALTFFDRYDKENDFARI
ncbi:MAG: histidinol phosphatase [Clostridia bacterium]|nr:histidinol phosphatase [Clostridia bacterium]